MVGQVAKDTDPLNKARPGYSATNDLEVGKKIVAKPDFWKPIWDEMEDVWISSEEVWIESFQVLPGFNLEHSDLKDWPSIRWNPVWWCMVGTCWILILPGHQFHSLLGQGEAVREDETEQERTVRSAWTYCYTGNMLLQFTWDLYQTCVLETANRRLAAWVACGIEVWYILGNIHLLFSMAQKDTVMMHALSVNRITFGLTLLFLCLMSWHEAENLPTRHFDLTLLSWLTRTAFALWMGFAPVGFKPLLALSYEDSDKEVTIWAKSDQWKFMAVGVLAPLFLLFSTLVLLALEMFRGELYWVPAMVVLLAFLLDGSNTSMKSLLATWMAVLPVVVIEMCFTVAGPYLWTAFAGA
mmetsp:Transcript_67843/g.119756  ORF Transcript_67843/g.119756 Transcript_67843/m.119756 type:complete len:354 (+) Transcript_67843:83-1144(+)